mgnify:CR=1 FL=1
MKTLTEKKREVKEELAYQASDICALVVKEHDGRANYIKERDRYHELAAQNIDAWDELTWQINELEEELDDMPCHIDPETGCPDAGYDSVYQKLEDAKADAEEWANTFEEMFEDLWVKLEEAIYGEGE